jgi:crossover junction endodeoxyribonuclease RuvC
MNAVLGIDLGLDGATSVLTSTGDPVIIHDHPTLQDGPAGRRSVNAILLSEIIANTGATMAYIEYVGARPGEAPSGAFSFGRSRP